MDMPLLTWVTLRRYLKPFTRMTSHPATRTVRVQFFHDSMRQVRSVIWNSLLNTLCPRCHIWNSLLNTLCLMCHIWNSLLNILCLRCHIWNSLLNILCLMCHIRNSLLNIILLCLRCHIWKSLLNIIIILQAVRHNILPDSSDEKQWHHLLGDYYERRCKDSAFLAEDLPIHLLAAGCTQRSVIFCHLWTTLGIFKTYVGHYKLSRCHLESLSYCHVAGVRRGPSDCLVVACLAASGSLPPVCHTSVASMVNCTICIYICLYIYVYIYIYIYSVLLLKMCMPYSMCF